jgi:hypothetical protein
MSVIYRPANGSEGDWFMGKFCEKCSHFSSEGFCQIIDASMAFEIEDEDYPKEWIQDDDYKNPRCTKFSKKGET